MTEGQSVTYSATDVAAMAQKYDWPLPTELERWICICAGVYAEHSDHLLARNDLRACIRRNTDAGAHGFFAALAVSFHTNLKWTEYEELGGAALEKLEREEKSARGSAST